MQSDFFLHPLKVVNKGGSWMVLNESIGNALQKREKFKWNLKKKNYMDKKITDKNYIWIKFI